MSAAMIGPVGFVGVGQMGSAMARRVLHQGVPVVAFDPSPDACRILSEAGAKIVDSAREVANECAVVSVVVNTDDQARRAVLGGDGVLDGADRGDIIAVHSTIHLSTLEDLAASAAARQVVLVDAAVTGGGESALRGELAVLVGGPASAMDAIRPALGLYASLVVHAGELGAGMSAKMANNLIGFCKMAAAYEGLRLAHAAGIDVDVLARVLLHSEAQSGLHSFYVTERAAALEPSYDGALREIGRKEMPKSRKDLDAALELARRLGIDLPITEIAYELMPEVWGTDG